MIGAARTPTVARRNAERGRGLIGVRTGPPVILTPEATGP